MGREAALFAARHYTLELLANNYDRIYASLLVNEPGMASAATSA